MKYERLTDEKFVKAVENCNMACVYGENCIECVYFDHDSCPETVQERLKKAISRLAELEDKIEQGTLKEVVRCKDCRFLEEKHYEDEGEKPYIKLVCKLLKKQIQPNDFCSYAEKRLKELQE